jgi:anti-sigma regulatory factor (Ser/Thr protein kinase)
MSVRGGLNLVVTSDVGELPTIRDAIRAWAGRHGWAEEQTADVVLAVDEALSNVIRHGYEGQPGHRIEIAARMLHDPAHGEGIEVCIRDFGKQVPLEKICGRDLDDLRPGGLGVHIIRSLMDSAEYSHAPGGGMRLLMRKYGRPTAEDQGSEAEET